MYHYCAAGYRLGLDAHKNSDIRIVNSCLLACLLAAAVVIINYVAIFAKID